MVLKIKCPKCNNKNCRKDGFVRNIQRYKCKKCNFRHTVQKKSSAASLSIKRYALQLYLEGLGFRSIGRILKFSYVSIYKWIKSFGKQLESLKSEKKVKDVEVDEMHTYVSNKKTINGFGLLLIELGKNTSTSLLVKEI